jgi:hypothetical protein
MNEYISLEPNDMAAQVILKRIDYYKKTPPENWDGVCKMDVK